MYLSKPTCAQQGAGEPPSVQPQLLSILRFRYLAWSSLEIWVTVAHTCPLMMFGFSLISISKFNLQQPLTSMTSKMPLRNILKIASNQCILPMRYESQADIKLKPNVLSSQGWAQIYLLRIEEVCPFADNMLFHTENTPEKNSFVFHTKRNK